MPCSCFGKKDKKGDGVAEEKYRPRDSKSRERESPPPAAPAPAPAAPPPAPVTPTPGGDARLRPEDDPDKASRRRDVVASFYSDQCELIGFKATGSRPPSTHVGGGQDAPAATSSPAASSPGSTRSGASCRADLAEKRREFFKELAVEDDDSSRPGSRPTSRMTDPGFQTTPRNSHYQEHHHYSLPHQSKTAPRAFKYSLPFAPGRSPNNAATVSEETQPLLEPSAEHAPDGDDEPANQAASHAPQEAADGRDLSGEPSSLKSCDLPAPDPSQDDRRQDVDVMGSSPLPQNQITQESPQQALLELSTESQQLIDLSVSERPEKNVEVLHVSVSESPEKRVEPVDLPVEAVSESAETRVKSLSESSETGIKFKTESSETGVELVTESTETGVELVTESSKASVELVTESSETGVELVAESSKAGAELVAESSETGVELVTETPEKDVDELVSAGSPLTEESPVKEGSQAFAGTFTSETIEPLVDMPAPERAQLRVEQQYVQQISVQSDDERAEEGSCILINEAFSVQSQESGITFPERNDHVNNDSTHENSHSPERDLCQKSSDEFEDEPSQSRPLLPEGRVRLTSLTYEDEIHPEGNDHSVGHTTVSENSQENSNVLGSPEKDKSLPIQEANLALEEPIPNNHPELLHHSLPPSFDSCFLTSAEEPEELLTEQSLHQHITKNQVAKEWSQVSEAPSRPPEEVKTTVEIVECIPKVPPLESTARPPPPAPPQDTPDPSPWTPTTRHDEDEPLPPAPPTPPVDDEPLPPPPPTPPAEDKPLPPAPPTPPADDEPLPPAPPTPPISSEPRLPPATCSMDHVSPSSVLEDDGLGSEIDDALSSLECLTEEELVSIMAGELAALVARLETAVERLEKAGLSGSGSGRGQSTAQPMEARRQGLIWGEECTVPFVLAYDDLLSGPFKIFFDCSMKIGGDVATIAKLVQSAFINQRAFLVMATKSQRPLDTELPEVLEPTGKKIQEVISFRESNRQSQYFNHLSAVSESITGLSWVAVTPAPSPYVKEMGDSAVFYTNKVLKEYREKDKLHVEWVQNWNNVFKELQEYVKKYHTTGLSWNSRGGNAMANLKAAPANCGVPPPPPPPAGNIPPPPPMVKLESKCGAAASEDDGRAALFASINKGTAITSGLKKVTDDMKTHKNPSLREGPKPFVKQSSPPSTVSPARDGPTGRPRVVLEGKKWFVEYQSDKPDIVIKETKMDQSVYIFRCQNTVVQVKGKINSVILDSCKKSSVVFDNLVSSAEVVNCQSCQVQVMGIMPILSIEKTDGCQVYLSKQSLKAEIVTAKSSEMNILIPKDDGEFVECPIPEQFKTVINGLTLSTTCSEKKG